MPNPASLTRIRTALALGAAAVVPLAMGAERAAAQSPEALPIYTVKSAGASPQQAERLARALDLPGSCAARRLAVVRLQALR